MGLDRDGELIRVTRGKNFHLVGGSRDTHHSMQEKCVRFNERLSARGKELDDLEHREFMDLAAECQMNVVCPRDDDGPRGEKKA